MPSRELKLPVPVNIITGHLGVGKTTLISHLIRNKPPNEHWAVLVNEFGALGIDAALLESSTETGLGEGLTVKQLAGGCMCCTLAGAFGVAIAQIVRRAKPHRLLIEPSGLGHPAGLLDVLQNEHLRTSLRIQAVICLVDPSQVHEPAWAHDDLIQSQLSIAEVVVLTKADLYGPDKLQAMEAHVNALYPPKVLVRRAERGNVPVEILSIAREAAFATLCITSGSTQADEPGSGATHFNRRESAAVGQPTITGGQTGSAAAVSTSMAPGRPYCLVRESADSQWTCGLMFHPDDVFDGELVLSVLRCLAARCQRVKGVFRVRTGYVHLQTGMDGDLLLAPIAYRRESRVEIIVGDLEHGHKEEQNQTEIGRGCAADERLQKVGGLQALQMALQQRDSGAVQEVLLRCLLA